MLLSSKQLFAFYLEMNVQNSMKNLKFSTGIYKKAVLEHFRSIPISGTSLV